VDQPGREPDQKVEESARRGERDAKLLLGNDDQPHEITGYLQQQRTVDPWGHSGLKEEPAEVSGSGWRLYGLHRLLQKKLTSDRADRYEENQELDQFRGSWIEVG